MRCVTVASLGLSMSLMFTACGHSSPAEPTAPNSDASAMLGGRIDGVVLNTAFQGVPTKLRGRDAAGTVGGRRASTQLRPQSQRRLPRLCVEGGSQ